MCWFIGSYIPSRLPALAVGNQTILPLQLSIMTTENSGNLGFANPAYRMFTGSTSVLGRTAEELRNSNETPVETGHVFSYTLTPRSNGGHEIVTPNGNVSRKGRGRIIGFRIDNNLFVEENDESKATHSFWVSENKNRIVTVEGKSYITAPAVV